MPFQPFIQARNLSDPIQTMGFPWEFVPLPEDLLRVRKMPKDKRRKDMIEPETNWNVYTAFRGLSANTRVSKDNPPYSMRGLVVDYDMKSNLEHVRHYVNQMEEQLRPNFLEVTLSGKARLVWVFERELLTRDSTYAQNVTKVMHEKMGLGTLLPGYDAASLKPAQQWTNGGEWHQLNETPLAWSLVQGYAVEAGKYLDYGRAEVPLDIIAAEVAKKFPNRWQGDFVVDALGRRFWDEKADNPSGCQVKPDGMLCFTGTKPFVFWADIFGSAWVDAQRATSLGKAASDLYFDGRYYWKPLGDDKYVSLSREDAFLELMNRGIPVKPSKGSTMSDAQKVLHYIQNNNRIVGSAPLVGQKPGLVIQNGEKYINTYTTVPMPPVDATDVDPEKDFPFLNHFLKGLFATPERRPLDHFLAWLRRFYVSFREYRPEMGQAVFLCGPKGNGKSLLGFHIIKPLMGGKVSDPSSHLKGKSEFNSHLFKTSLLVMDDSEAPDIETRRALMAKIKAFVVKPYHQYAAKYQEAMDLAWCGRIFSTLNDDPSSVGILPEVNSNTADKLCFFASQPYDGVFPDRYELEALIAKELPFFARWLLEYKPPADILVPDRMGVKSYYDLRIYLLSIQQDSAYDLLELVRSWIRESAYFTEGVDAWEGDPTTLHTQLSCLGDASRKWDAQKINTGLGTLARFRTLGISYLDRPGERVFKIEKAKALNPPSVESMLDNVK